MIGVRGARVVIVDDEEKEALPIIEAFSKKGIPVVFINYDKNTPEEKLTGIRLAILDMELVQGVTEDKSKISTTIAYLANIISKNNGPYAVLIWTKYPGLKEYFEKSIFSQSEIPKPVFTIMLTKSECKNHNGTFNIDLIFEKLMLKFQEFSPLYIIQTWEEQCFYSASNVTNKLSNLAECERDELESWREAWKHQFLQLIFSMAKSNFGEKLNEENCLISFYNLLNPLHADKMDKSSELNLQLSKKYSAEIIKTQELQDEHVKAKINTQIHLSFNNLDNFDAGNIYIFNTKIKPNWVPSINNLLDTFIEQEKDKTIEIKNLILKKLRRMIVEISPLCDHSQKNIEHPRFLSGLISPKNIIISLDGAEKKINLKAKGDFLYIFGPLYLKNIIPESGIYYIYLSARHLITGDFKDLKKLRASARIRKQALNELQSWLSYHASRPGKVILR